MRPKFALTITLCVVVAASAAAAQQVYVTLSSVHFFVTDRNGRFVSNLSASDFTIYDNERPQEIRTFMQRVHSPVSMALILDRSHSLSEPFPLVLQSAAAFVTSAIHDREDQAALVAFDSKVYLAQNWTSDSKALVDKIHALTAAGGTSIFDALLKTCRDRFDGADTRQRIVVLVTDGEDTTSVATFDDALQMARLSRAVVYVLGVRSEHSMNSRELQGRRVLANLAELTGGRVFYPADYEPATLQRLFAALQEELRNGYTVTYSLDVPPDHTFHTLRIEPKNKSLSIHAPTGYYARRLRQ